MERLVRKEEYDAAKGFISRLRAKSDPQPQLISPPLKFKGAQKQRCVENVVKYCMKNTEYEPAKGFKLWVLPAFPVKGQSTPYIALVHVVVRHKESGKFYAMKAMSKASLIEMEQVSHILVRQHQIYDAREVNRPFSTMRG